MIISEMSLRKLIHSSLRITLIDAIAGIPR